MHDLDLQRNSRLIHSECVMLDALQVAVAKLAFQKSEAKVPIASQDMDNSPVHFENFLELVLQPLRLKLRGRVHLGLPVLSTE